MNKSGKESIFNGKVKDVYMIGIGGASMSGLALILQDKGYNVSGLDMMKSTGVKRVREAGIEVAIGKEPEGIEDSDLVVYTAAVSDDHPGLVAARKLGIPAIDRAELLGIIASEFKNVVAICGTHGKTTSTSMTAQIMVDCGMDPSVHIGGVLDSIGGGIRLGHSDIFLTEACEYKRSYMSLNPSHIVILNIDEDHLDYYRDINEIEESFRDFLRKLPDDGWALGCGEDPRIMRHFERLSCLHETFGISGVNDYHMNNICEDKLGHMHFDMCYHGESLGRVELAVPGAFNAMNALASLALCHHMGADMKKAMKSIAKFTGARRRFEKTGTLNGAEIFHDYGHNPAEMRNAVSIARKRCRGKLWVVVQPHTFSRVKKLYDGYLSCTQEADVTLVTDIFAAREVDPKDINSEMIVSSMKKNGVNAIHTPCFEDAERLIREGVKEGDLVITMGCGDIYKLNDMLNK